MKDKLTLVAKAVGLYLVTNKKARTLEIALAVAVWEEAAKPALTALF